MSFPTRSQIFKDPVWKIKEVLAKPSLDTFYQVDFSFGKYQTWLENSSSYDKQVQNLASGSDRVQGLNFQKKLSLLCNEAEIPGTSYLTTQVDGNRQGISEVFPTFRQFPPLNLSFYLDCDHVVLDVFESWMRYINPIVDSVPYNGTQNNAFTRFNYPDSYKETIHLTKYERDLKYGSKMSQYEFKNIWPTNMTSMRVNYGSSDVIKVSVQLAYDRFFTQFGIGDSRPTVSNMPSEIRDTDAIINANRNKWWTPTRDLPLGMNDQLRSIQSGWA